MKFQSSSKTALN